MGSFPNSLYYPLPLYPASRCCIVRLKIQRPLYRSFPKVFALGVYPSS